MLKDKALEEQQGQLAYASRSLEDQEWDKVQDGETMKINWGRFETRMREALRHTWQGKLTLAEGVAMLDLIMATELRRGSVIRSEELEDF